MRCRQRCQQRVHVLPAVWAAPDATLHTCAACCTLLLHTRAFRCVPCRSCALRAHRTCTQMRCVAAHAQPHRTVSTACSSAPSAQPQRTVSTATAHRRRQLCATRKRDVSEHLRVHACGGDDVHLSRGSGEWRRCKCSVASRGSVRQCMQCLQRTFAWHRHRRLCWLAMLVSASNPRLCGTSTFCFSSIPTCRAACPSTLQSAFAVNNIA